MANNKSAIRLHEIGPRLTIELIKIQNELFTGEVLYHNAIVKSEEEIAEMKKAREEKKRQKELRKKIQNENVVKKEREKVEHKKRSMVGNIKSESNDNPNEVEHVDNDADYYREAVGEEPDEGIYTFIHSIKICIARVRHRIIIHRFNFRIVSYINVNGRS